MKYFVVSDVHGYYSAMKQSLDAAGFDETSNSHMLIVCGDLMDRGYEAERMQTYILHLMERKKVILVRGNHEDLVLEMLDNFDEYAPQINFTHHYRNGTFNTMLDLTGTGFFDAIMDRGKFVADCRNTPYIKTIIPSAIDFFETPHYVFVHGWIPCKVQLDPLARYSGERVYKYLPEWRNATQEDWNNARWFNGMELAHYHDVVEPDKTIVCGHWHCSWGWSHIKQKRKEFPQKNGSDWEKSFEPYKENGIIAIDGCTAYSGIVNCIVIDD